MSSVLAINRFSIGLYELLIISLGLATISVVQIGGANIRLWEIFLSGIIVVVSLQLAVKGNVVVRGKALCLVGFSFLLVVLLSSMNAYDLALWGKQTLLLLALMLLLGVVSQRYSDRELLSNMRLIVYPGILIAAWGIVEVIYFPLSLQTYSMGGLVVPRARSFFAEANEFSQYLSLPFSFILSALMINKTLLRWERRFYHLGLVILVMAQFMSYSRGGLLAFAVVLIGLFFYLKTSDARVGKYFVKANLWILLTAVLFWILYLTQPVFTEIFQTLLERVNSLFSGSDITLAIRLDGINVALDRSTESVANLMIGIGFGNLTTILGDEIATTANLFVDIFSELGLLGLISFTVIVVVTAAIPFRVLKELERQEDGVLLSLFVGAYLSFTALIAGGLTYATHMLNLFWFIIGLLFAFSNYVCKKQEERKAIVAYS